MELDWIENLHAEHTDFTTKGWINAEYDHCKFAHCNLGGLNLSANKFSDCIFEHCNLSLVTLNQTILRNVRFAFCKMQGLMFDTCKPLGLSLSFEACQLDHSSFYGVKLKETVFNHCRLLEADFTGADLSGATFSSADLSGATFENTVLEQADFRTASNFIIDPTMNKMKGAQFLIDGLPGLLQRFHLSIE